MTRRIVFGAGAVAALALAGALGLDLPAAGEEPARPSLFELTDVHVFDVKDFAVTLTAGRRCPRCFYNYHFEPFGTATIDVGLDPLRGRVLDVHRLDVVATADDPPGEPGAGNSDALADGARGRARFAVRPGARIVRGRPIPSVRSFLTLRARLASGTRVTLISAGPSGTYRGRDYMSVFPARSTLRGGIVPTTFSRSVYDPQTQTSRAVPLEKVKLRGLLPIRGGQMLRFTAAWDTPTQGTVTFDSPSMYAGRTGTISVRGDGRYVIRGERGSRIRIVVDPSTGAGTVSLGYGSFRVGVLSFALDGALPVPPGGRGPGDVEASYLRDQAVLAPDDVVVVAGWADFRADYVVVRDAPPDGPTVWFFGGARLSVDGGTTRVTAFRVSTRADLTPFDNTHWVGASIPATGTFDEAVEALRAPPDSSHVFAIDGSAPIRRAGGRIRGLARDDRGVTISFDVADPLDAK